VPTATTPDPTARYLKVRNHALNLLFQTPLRPNTWHNFAVQVDWERRTLAVLFSHDASLLSPVTGVINNNSTASGAAGQGDYHWGILKVLNSTDRGTELLLNTSPFDTLATVGERE
jgi:hypothetical protein